MKMNVVNPSPVHHLQACVQDHSLGTSQIPSDHNIFISSAIDADFSVFGIWQEQTLKFCTLCNWLHDNALDREASKNICQGDKNLQITLSTEAR